MNNMPRTIKDRLSALDRTLPGSALIGALLGCGLALPLHAALGLTGSMALVPLLCAAIALALAAVCVNRWTMWIGGTALLAMAGFWLMTQAGALPNLYPALALLAGGHSMALRLFSGLFTTLFCAVFTSAGFSLARRAGGFYPALSLTLVVLLGVWFYGNRSQIALCLPSLLALMLLYGISAEHGTALRRLLPMALGAALLALLLLPGQSLTSKPLEEAANRVREMIYDYFFFTEPRTSYTLQSDGYQPMGERLGGPANPIDRPVMEVRAALPVLLRGTVKDTYSGLNWYDGASGRRYLYIDPRFTGLRDSLLDAQRPNSAARRGSSLFTAQAVDVVMTNPGVSTLFVPQRFSALRSGADMVPYFNASSEIFVTRDTAPGDAYGVSAYVFTSDTPGIAELVESLRGQGEDPHYAEIQGRYLQVPAVVEQPVQALADQLTAGAHTPYEKAMALTRHLRTAYPYTLDQSVPPASRDFVTWFLTTEKQGYCTSFASALAVMGRIVGLPTRYIEGYAALPANGIAQVTGKNAHAWVEIYFENFGWLSFDATPAQDPNHDPNQDSDQSPEGGGNASPPPSQPPSNNTPEPTDEPPPTPEPTEQPTGEEDEDTSPDTTPTPTPEPSPSPTPAPYAPPGSTPPPSPPEDEPPQPPFWLLWLLIPLLLAALVWRIYSTHPLRAAAKQADADAKLMVWYRGLSQLLETRGLALDPAESPLAYFERAERALADASVGKRRGKAAGARRRVRAASPVSLIPIAGEVCSIRYGGRAVGPDTFDRAGAAYGVLWRMLSPVQKLKALWRRTLRGVGNIRQVP